MNEEKLINFYTNFNDTLLSLIRLLLKTKFSKTRKIIRKHDQCVIMGNGPSLISSLQENKEHLSNCDLVAVNYFGLTPEYVEYKPSIYVLCDPAFWFEHITDDHVQKVKNFYQTLTETTTWNIQLFLPWKAKRQHAIKDILSANKHIQITFFNNTKFEGFNRIKHSIWDKQWGMPRTQNVLIAALMLIIYSDYRTIYLAGSDNDWAKFLWVDELNRVHRDDFHFYKNNDANTYRILPEKMHECYLQAYYSLLSYYRIRQYIDSKNNIKIINLCMTSYIDSFDKMKSVEE